MVEVGLATDEPEDVRDLTIVGRQAADSRYRNYLQRFFSFEECTLVVLSHSDLADGFGRDLARVLVAVARVKQAPREDALEALVLCIHLLLDGNFYLLILVDLADLPTPATLEKSLPQAIGTPDCTVTIAVETSDLPFFCHQYVASDALCADDHRFAFATVTVVRAASFTVRAGDDFSRSWYRVAFVRLQRADVDVTASATSTTGVSVGIGCGCRGRGAGCRRGRRGCRYRTHATAAATARYLTEVLLLEVVISDLPLALEHVSQDAGLFDFGDNAVMFGEFVPAEQLGPLEERF